MILEDFLVHIAPHLRYFAKLASLSLSNIGIVSLAAFAEVLKRVPNTVSALTLLDAPQPALFRQLAIAKLPVRV
jgi:hypothetical protein